MTEKIQTFKQLNAWKEAQVLARMMYEETQGFPKAEGFGLTNQIRRAAVLVTSNIAEGFHRFSKKEKVQFYHIAYGSIAELDSQLMLATDVGYLKSGRLKLLQVQLEKAHKILNGLIRKSKET